MKIAAVPLTNMKIIIDDIGGEHQVAVHDVAWVEPVLDGEKESLLIYRKSDPTHPVTIEVGDEATKEEIKALVASGELLTELDPEAKKKWDEMLASIQ